MKYKSGSRLLKTGGLMPIRQISFDALLREPLPCCRFGEPLRLGGGELFGVLTMMFPLSLFSVKSMRSNGFGPESSLSDDILLVVTNSGGE